MGKKITEYWQNGGKKEILKHLIQIIVYVGVGIFILGKFVGSEKVEKQSQNRRITQLEIRQQKSEENINELLQRMARVETNTNRILEILQGKYKH